MSENKVKNAHHNFPKPEVMSLNALFGPNSQKLLILNNIKLRKAGNHHIFKAVTSKKFIIDSSSNKQIN